MPRNPRQSPAHRASAAVGAFEGILWQHDPNQWSILMSEIIFIVEEAPEGGYNARALGVSIFTQAETTRELHDRVRDAVHCHFDEATRPSLSVCTSCGTKLSRNEAAPRLVRGRAGKSPVANGLPNDPPDWQPPTAEHRNPIPASRHHSSAYPAEGWNARRDSCRRGSASEARPRRAIAPSVWVSPRGYWGSTPDSQDRGRPTSGAGTVSGDPGGYGPYMAEARV